MKVIEFVTYPVHPENLGYPDSDKCIQSTITRNFTAWCKEREYAIYDIHHAAHCVIVQHGCHKNIIRIRMGWINRIVGMKIQEKKGYSHPACEKYRVTDGECYLNPSEALIQRELF